MTQNSPRWKFKLAAAAILDFGSRRQQNADDYFVLLTGFLMRPGSSDADTETEEFLQDRDQTR